MINNIIELKDNTLQDKQNAYTNLDRLLNHRFTQATHKTLILQHQLDFLLGVYKGFKEDQYYYQFLDKAHQMIQLGIEQKKITDLLSGVILYTRMILVRNEKEKAYEFLSEKMEEFSEIGIGEINPMLEREIAKIEEIKLQGNELNKLQLLKIESYIKEASQYIEDTKI